MNDFSNFADEKTNATRVKSLVQGPTAAKGRDRKSSPLRFFVSTSQLLPPSSVDTALAFSFKIIENLIKNGATASRDSYLNLDNLKQDSKEDLFYHYILCYLDISHCHVN